MAARQVLTRVGCALLLLGAGCGSDGGDAPGADTPTVDVAPDVASGEPDGGAAVDVPVDTPPDAGGDVGPAPPVEYAVGFTRLDVTTPSGRDLPVALWYPAEAPDPDTPPHLYLGMVTRDAILDAPIAAGGPWPFIVFSHGSSGLKEQSIFLMEGLARAGYVIAAPDHVGNTIFDFDADAIGQLALERPADVRAVIDRVADPADGDPAWLGTAADLGQVAVLGHSFGGYTTLAVAGATPSIDAAARAACQATPGTWGCQIVAAIDAAAPVDFYDPRVRAAVPMAPAAFVAFGADGLGAVPVPVLVLAGAQDLTTPLAGVVQPIFDALPAPKWLWALDDGNHYHFADFCELLAAAPPDMLQPEMAAVCEPDAPLPIGRAHELILGITRAFLDVHLKGDAAAGDALAEDAAEAVDPQVEMTAVP